jgi:hypothetical protein
MMLCAGAVDWVMMHKILLCSGAVDWVMMQSCFGHHFMLVLEKQEKFDGHQQFFAIVQLIGTRKQAENFAYRFVFLFICFSFPSFIFLMTRSAFGLTIIDTMATLVFTKFLCRIIWTEQ